MFGFFPTMRAAEDKGQQEVLKAKTLQHYPPLPEELRKTPKAGLIGGSGVVVEGKERYSMETPFGTVVNISFLDAAKKVIFVNRHLCTHTDPSNGEVRYAPPHEVNFHAMVWCLHACNATRVVALSSTGSLAPDVVKVGSVVMPDDFFMVKPDACTFWGHPAIGAYAPDDSKGQVGRIHFAPAIKDDAAWMNFRVELAEMVRPVLSGPAGNNVVLCNEQSKEVWPLNVDPERALEHSPCVYVNAVGPRFETRAEIRSYKQAGGAVVGMTCGYEWILCSELQVPYALISVVDNACNGLSTYPGGAVQEYLAHKVQIQAMTTELVGAIVKGLSP